MEELVHGLEEELVLDALSASAGERRLGLGLILVGSENGS